MFEPRFDDDELAFRLSALGRATEQTDGPGLADVHRRRDRRHRRSATAAGTAALAVVATLALVVVVQPFESSTAIAPAGVGSTQAAEQAAREAAVRAAEASAARRAEQSAAGARAHVLDADSIVLTEELAAAGLPVGTVNQGDPDGQPSLPPLCAMDSWQAGYSAPGLFQSGSFAIDGGTLAVDLLSYDGDVAANAALVKLKEDARNCPVVNEFARIEVTAVGSAIGDEFVIFRLDIESGQDGSIRPIWVTIARTGNVLVSAAVSQDEVQEAQDNEQVSRDAAQAGVDHLVTG